MNDQPRERLIRKYCLKYGYGGCILHYWLGHLVCEVEGCGRYSDAPYQIKDESEDPENLIALCTPHRSGPEGIRCLGHIGFVKQHPELQERILGTKVFS